MARTRNNKGQYESTDSSDVTFEVYSVIKYIIYFIKLIPWILLGYLIIKYMDFSRIINGTLIKIACGPQCECACQNKNGL